MALNDNSKLSIAFKKLLGKAHTDNGKQFYSEAFGSSVQVAGQSIPTLAFPASPASTNLYDITNSSGFQAVELVRLRLILDPTSNNFAYYAQLPAAYQANSTNTKAGTAPFLDNQQIRATAGAIQIVPPVYGTIYEAKPYIGGTAAKGSGTLIPPGDARDWVFDYFNGIFTQQTVGTAPDYIECYIYIGSMLSESAAGGANIQLSNIAPIADVDMNSQKIINVDDPTNAQDVATKAYVDAVAGSAGFVQARLYDPVATSVTSGPAIVSPYVVDGVTVANGDYVLFSNLSVGDNRIYEASIAGPVITWTVVNAFDSNPSPTAGSHVIIGEGQAYQLQAGKFDGTDWLFNNKVRYFNGLDYMEQSALNTITLNDNQVAQADVFSIAAAGSENNVIEYSVKRGAIKETGTILITHDGTTASLTQFNTEFADSGVVFFADISGGNLRLRYTTTSTGSTAAFKFTVRRWSDAPGGPGNLPSYSVGGSFANQTLSNLTSPTSINQDIRPDSDLTRKVGSSSLRFLNVHTRYLSNATVDAIDLSTYQFKDSGSVLSGDWDVRKFYNGAGVEAIDYAGSGTVIISAELDVNTNKIINLVDPTNPQDAATKAYVDASTGAVSTATIANNQVSPANVAGLSFNGAVHRSVEIAYSIYRNTSSDELMERGNIYIGYKAVAGTWDIDQVKQLDDAGVILTITPGGQIRFTSTNVAGTGYVGNIKWSVVSKEPA